MAEIISTEPALSDLNAIADYIALDKPTAAIALVQRVFTLVEQLRDHPVSGSRPLELGKKTRYRQLIEEPCRVFYRYDGRRVYILYLMRSERLLRIAELESRDRT